MTGLFDLTGKVAVVTGPEGNLGPIWREALVGAGAACFGVGLPQYDITEETDRQRAFMKCKNIMRVPDIIVCNAAIDTPPTQPLARFFTDIEKTVETNLTAHARLIEKFLPEMRALKRGVIVLIGSIQGYIGADWRNYSGGFEKPVGYNVSKAALQQLARSITVQYGRDGIRAVCPGFGPVLSDKLPEDFRAKITEKIPMRRTVSKESLQQTLLYACCCQDLAGEDWLVDGGYTKW